MLEMGGLSPEDPLTGRPSQSRVFRGSCSLCDKDEASDNQLKGTETHRKTSSEAGEIFSFILDANARSRGTLELRFKRYSSSVLL